MKNNNIPKLRYPEFTDAWEKCKLERYLKTSTLKNTESQYSKEDVLSVSGEFGIVNQIKFKGRSFAGASVENYSIVNTGDVVYTKSPLQNNPYGIIKANKGIAGIVSTLYAVYHPKEEADPEFIQTYFELHSRTNNYLAPLVNKGAKNDMKVSSDNALKGGVIFPTLPEQQKIGTLFRRLDRLITLHKRKWDDVILLKKALLQKMFPENDERLPEIRFPEFSGDWEKCKLGDLGTIEMNKRIFKEQTSTIGEIPFYKIGTFGGKADAFISKELFEEYKSKYPYPNKGDLLISASGSVGKVVEYSGKDEYFQDSNIVWFNHNGKLNNLFLKQFYSHVQWEGLEGSTIKRLYNKTILGTQISFPSLPEQQKIGTFFRRLDRLISHHQQQYEHYQLLKKALLQQMFI
ncbi:restriction endonuclease subunit S [Avibacterium paragallinarum]|uniref:restriction endonuclease subunit S n=1 Tax=Avibacterium paragallinarum TaxID=728 RepID=UPI003987ABD0